MTLSTHFTLRRSITDSIFPSRLDIRRLNSRDGGEKGFENIDLGFFHNNLSGAKQYWKGGRTSEKLWKTTSQNSPKLAKKTSNRNDSLLLR
jgi:hypothetical protein